MVPVGVVHTSGIKWLFLEQKTLAGCVREALQSPRNVARDRYFSSILMFPGRPIHLRTGSQLRKSEAWRCRHKPASSFSPMAEGGE